MLALNQTGSHKLKPTIIGKSANPACWPHRTASQDELLIGPNRGVIAPFGQNSAYEVLNGPCQIWIRNILTSDFLFFN